MQRIITLTTDFGLRDPYQGAMKGAILSVNPAAAIIDISHLVASANVLEGAFVMHFACPYFPDGSIHVGVVDPGVGSERKAILVETKRYLFIGPDNGLVSLAAKDDGIKRVIELENARYFRKEVSDTFHGRDIFGPVAAHLSLGVDPAELGRPLDNMTGLDLPGTEIDGSEIKGEIIYIDTFGNAVTNIRRDEIRNGVDFEISVKGIKLIGVKRTYSMAGKGSPVALIGSTGFLEVAVNNGSAAQALGIRVGDKVTLRAIAPRVIDR